MQLTIPAICAIATFVLISDHLRIVAAEEQTLKSSSLKRIKRQKYTSQYDNFDVDRVLHSERLLRSYIKCLLDKGPCTKEGRELKKHLPDALKTDCSKCTDIQKQQGGKVLTFVLQNYRSDWDQLVQKYDPEGIFRKKYGYEEDNEDDDEEGDDARRK